MPASTLRGIPAHQSKPFGRPGPQILADERAKATFSSGDLAAFILGDDFRARVKRILPVLEAEPSLEKKQIFFMSRTDKFLHGYNKEKLLFRLTEMHGWDQEDVEVAEHLLDTPGGWMLHKSMFLKTLEIATTDEQKKLFYEPALRYEIIGCYSQTELGHGSNVQGLETTATYDPATESFILHSPTLTAAKWWSGGLGLVASHSIVMAQLLVPGANGTLENVGPHTFIVPIRDLKTRECLPGRIIGDVGPKAGFNAVDNGTMLLDHVSIPHVNFLAKHAKVDIKTGRYTKPASAKLSYGTMTASRASIIRTARTFLARSAVVAIRYCCIRHQFADKDAVEVNGVKPPEVAVLDYQIVQARVFPVLVQSFAVHFTQRDFLDLYAQNEAAMARGDFSLNADVHASASGLKSICTITAAQGIEEARRALGGHGYSLASGLAGMFAEYVPAVTWEGDSYMLTQQVGRYLFKTYRALKENPSAALSPGNRTGPYLLEYLRHPSKSASFKTASAFSDPKFFIDAFGHRAASMIADAVHKRDVENSSWNDLLVDIYRCSVAHSQYVLVLNFANVILSDAHLAANKSLHAVLKTCFEYFAIYTMDTEIAEFIYSGDIDKDQHTLIKARLRQLLKEIRPNAVALADGWDISDYELNSILGRYDGDVYPNIMKFAQQEPLNTLRFNPDPRDPELLLPSSKVAKALL